MPTPATTLDFASINAMDAAAFTAALGGIFEHSPWVASRAWTARPFADVAQLHGAMAAEVARATPAERLALLRAHPELAGKEAQAGVLTAASTAEQKGAGLINLSAEEKARIARLNAAYRDRHGFPFIIAVRNHNRAQIFAEFERRLGQGTPAETEAALAQVQAIARLRLEALLGA